MATETESNMTELIVGQQEEEKSDPIAEEKVDNQSETGGIPQWAIGWCWEWGNGNDPNSVKSENEVVYCQLPEENTKEKQKGWRHTLYCNVPQLQYLYHFANDGETNFEEKTYVRMIDLAAEPIDDDSNKPINFDDIDPNKHHLYRSGPPPLNKDGEPVNKWCRLEDVPELYRMVKYPQSTWELIEDELNAVAQFEAIDADKNGSITKEEFEAFWKAQGIKGDDLENKKKAFDRADIDNDGGLDINEFKQSFFGLNDKCCNDDFKIRLSRWAFVIIIPILGLLLCAATDEVPLSVIMGFSIELMYLIYFATLGYYFYEASTVNDEFKNRDDSYLYRVFSRPGTARLSEGKWAPLSMTINQIAWPLKCVHSVSEFSAVDGAIPAVMLANIGTYTWAMVTVFFMQRAFYDEWEWQFSDICQIIGVAGLVLLGVFEADPYNPSVMKAHMIGAFMGFGTVLGYIAQNIERSGNNDAANDTNTIDTNALDTNGWQYSPGVNWSWGDWEEIDDGEASIRTSLSWLLFILFLVFYTLWQVTLAICYFQEGNSWGIYDEKVEDRKWVKKDDCCKKCESTCCCQVSLILCGCCSIFTAVPLLLVLCVAPCYLYGKGKHEKAIKKLTAGDLGARRRMLDFQPCLPDYKQRLTKDTKRTITAFSVANVLFEGIVLLVGSTALCLWLMGYSTYCDGPCPEQMFIFILLLIVTVFGVIAVYTLFGFCPTKKFGDGTLDRFGECDRVKVCCC